MQGIDNRRKQFNYNICLDLLRHRTHHQRYLLGVHLRGRETQGSGVLTANLYDYVDYLELHCRVDLSRLGTVTTYNFDSPRPA